MDDRVVRAIRLLESSIARKPDYPTIAAAVGLSPQHFYFLFTTAIGETPGAFLRRLRLDLAATLLRWTLEPVKQIAAAVGYASQPSFTQAFGRQYGMTPLAFRRERERWPEATNDNAAGNNRVVLVERDPLSCLCRRFSGPPCDVPAHWSDFLADLPLALQQAHPLFVGVIYDDVRFTQPERVRYDCCIVPMTPVSDEDVAAARLHRLEIASGLYASIQHSGYYAASTDPEGRRSVAATYERLLDGWLARSSYSLVKHHAVEIYPVPHSRCDPADLSCTLMIPVA